MKHVLPRLRRPVKPYGATSRLANLGVIASDATIGPSDTAPAMCADVRGMMCTDAGETSDAGLGGIEGFPSGTVTVGRPCTVTSDGGNGSDGATGDAGARGDGADGFAGGAGAAAGAAVGAADGTAVPRPPACPAVAADADADADADTDADAEGEGDARAGAAARPLGAGEPLALLDSARRGPVASLAGAARRGGGCMKWYVRSNKAAPDSALVTGPIAGPAAAAACVAAVAAAAAATGAAGDEGGWNRSAAVRLILLAAVLGGTGPSGRRRAGLPAGDVAAVDGLNACATTLAAGAVAGGVAIRAAAVGAAGCGALTAVGTSTSVGAGAGAGAAGAALGRTPFAATAAGPTADGSDLAKSRRRGQPPSTKHGHRRSVASMSKCTNASASACHRHGKWPHSGLQCELQLNWRGHDGQFATHLQRL